MKNIFFDTNDLRSQNFFSLEEEILAFNGSKYELTEWIGRGGNASVYKARNVVTGEDVAIKFQLNLKDYNKKRFSREITLLKRLVSDHIIKYIANGEVKAFHKRLKFSANLPFVVMELADTNLYSFRKSSSIRSELYTGQFRGLASALATLHELAIHRDIKPENILISGERWLLSDYGLCTFIAEESDLTPESANVGPRYWLSPEAHNFRIGNNDVISKASDVFQLAAVFWFVVTGRHPCGVLTRSDWTGPEKLYDLIQGCLYHNSLLRPQDGSHFFKELSLVLQD